MAHHAQVHSSHNPHARAGFKQRFKKNLTVETMNAYNILLLLLTIIFGVIYFILEFSATKIILGIVLPFIIVYYGGMYLTLIPMWIVTVVALAPKRFSLPALGVAIFFSFIFVFLV